MTISTTLLKIARIFGPVGTAKPRVPKPMGRAEIRATFMNVGNRPTFGIPLLKGQKPTALESPSNFKSLLSLSNAVDQTHIHGSHRSQEKINDTYPPRRSEWHPSRFHHEVAVKSAEPVVRAEDVEDTLSSPADRPVVPPKPGWLMARYSSATSTRMAAGDTTPVRNPPYPDPGVGDCCNQPAALTLFDLWQAEGQEILLRQSMADFPDFRHTIPVDPASTNNPAPGSVLPTSDDTDFFGEIGENEYYVSVGAINVHALIPALEYPLALEREGHDVTDEGISLGFDAEVPSPPASPPASPHDLLMQEIREKAVKLRETPRTPDTRSTPTGAGIFSSLLKNVAEKTDDSGVESGHTTPDGSDIEDGW